MVRGIVKKPPTDSPVATPPTPADSAPQDAGLGRFRVLEALCDIPASSLHAERDVGMMLVWQGVGMLVLGIACLAQLVQSAASLVGQGESPIPFVILLIIAAILLLAGLAALGRADLILAHQAGRVKEKK